MSYLTDAVHEIESKEGASFYSVIETEHVDLNTPLDAHDVAERMYRKTYNYTGYFHTVAEKTEDGYRVIVMEE